MSDDYSRDILVTRVDGERPMTRNELASRPFSPLHRPGNIGTCIHIYGIGRRVMTVLLGSQGLSPAEDVMLNVQK